MCVLSVLYLYVCIYACNDTIAKYSKIVEIAPYCSY